MTEPIYIAAGPADESEWPSRLPLYAVASGDGKARDIVREAFGAGVEFPHLWDRASAHWRADAAGLRVEIHEHPTLRFESAISGPDCLLFDPWDDANLRPVSDALAVFKRSASTRPAPNDIAYPAWFRRATLDLTCGPAPDADRPVVTFCGVAHRPTERATFVERFEACPAMDVRVIRRERFAHPDAAAFLDSIRQAHFVLCPPGVGRFSYRLYETLAAGRVPVVPPGTHTIPREIQNHAHICIASTPEEIAADWRANIRADIDEIHARNRDAWIEYASPLGALCWLADAVRRLEACT